MMPLWWLLSLGCIPKIDPGPVPVQEAARPVDILQMKDESVPSLYLQALIAAGSAYDPVGREGLAALTAQSLSEAGAGERDPDGVRTALYPTGNALEVQTDREWVSLRLRCHTDHADLCVALFSDALTAPLFEAESVRRIREDQRYEVSEGMLSNEERLGEEVFNAWLFEGHPYGHPVAGRAGVLPLLDTDDVRAFYRAHYVRGAIRVGIAGRYGPEHVTQLAEALEALPTELPRELSLQAPEPITGRQLLAVDTETPVTGFHFGHPLAVTRSHPDYPSLVLAMTAFGAHRQSSGRLFQRMRTARGLNYGDYAYVEPFVQRGWSSMPEQGVLRRQPFFYVWIRPTSVENGAFALKFAVDEVDSLVESGLTEAEFEDARRYLLGKLPLWAQDPGRRLAYALDAAVTDSPNGITELATQIDALTVSDVNAALERHIQTENLKIVAISGEAGLLSATLGEETETPIVYADVRPDEAQRERDTEIAKMPLNLRNARTVTAEGIFR